MGKSIEIENGDKLPIPEFSLNEMCTHPSIVMIAKRGSGKSWVTKAILYHFYKLPVGIIIAPTDRENCFYGDFFPNSYIFYEYKSAIIKRLLFRQQIMIKKMKEKEKNGKKLDARAILIMDDCLAEKKKWVNDPYLKEILMNGRHKHITYVLTMQYALGITPDLRSNFDYIFLLAEDFITNLKKIYDHYAGMFPDFGSFRQVFKQLTEDFGAMVIKNRGARASLLDKIAFYKAPNLDGKSVDFGCKQFRRDHEKNYNKKWEDKSFETNYEDFLLEKKQNKGAISVKKVFIE